MALNTFYTYNIELKYAKLTFRDDGAELAYFELDNDVLTLSPAAEFSVVPTWGTNSDIKDWYNYIDSIAPQMQLNRGQVRDGFEHEIKVDSDGVTAKIEVNGEKIGDWEWAAATNILTIFVRNEAEINFTEFRLFVQWMLHFQDCVENFGG